MTQPQRLTGSSAGACLSSLLWQLSVPARARSLPYSAQCSKMKWQLIAERISKWWIWNYFKLTKLTDLMELGLYSGYSNLNRSVLRALIVTKPTKKTLSPPLFYVHLYHPIYTFVQIINIYTQHFSQKNHNCLHLLKTMNLLTFS